jgi:hypothetical protein
MPGTARARQRRSRARPPREAKPAPNPILDLAKEMHLPMNEARDLVQAIELAGLGITELGSDYGAAVTTLARAAAERLATFDDLVMDLIQLAYHFEEAAGIER